MNHRSWHISPRDPLVFDSGTRLGGPPSLLPPQPSLAGCIRGAYFDAVRPAGSEAALALARRLLGIELRGPWLLDHEAEDTPALNHLFVPCPADLGRINDDDQRPSLLAARLHELQEHEGVHLPGSTPPPRHLLAVPPRSSSSREGVATKVRDTSEYTLSLEDAIDYSLDAGAAATQDPTTLDRLKIQRSIQAETRTHVSIKSDTLTADPEQLFVSRGRRLSPNLTLAIDVTAPDDLPHPAEGLIFLGGEARPSRLAIRKQAVWPAFDRVRERYRAAIARHLGHPLALRLALLTPGDFDGWRPPTLTGPHQQPLELLAACHGRYLAVSGWDLRKRRPRPVRRLVPAGAVYLYAVPSDVDLLELCEHFWARPLRSEAATSDPNNTLAPVQNDGYGLALPGIRLLTASPA